MKKESRIYNYSMTPEAQDNPKTKMVNGVPRIKISILVSSSVKSKEEAKNASSVPKTQITWGIIRKNIDDSGSAFRKENVFLRVTADINRP